MYIYNIFILYIYIYIYIYNINLNLMLLSTEFLSLIYLKIRGIWSNIFYLSVVNVLPIYSSLTNEGEMRDTPSLEFLVSAMDLKICEITLLDSIRDVFRTHSSFYEKVISQK